MSNQPIVTEWSDRNQAKDAVRNTVWAILQHAHACRRDPVGHIPNFIGAEQAAERLTQLPIWQQAQVIKCNPDSPQMPVRLRALQAGKRLYMAVPRLTRKHCFVELTAEHLHQQNVPLEQAAQMKQALIYGRLVSFAEMQPIDLVIVGCVAAADDGGRTGKGAGFADLELAMLQQFGLVSPTTAIATTVHALQIADSVPLEPHDWPLDWIVTPETVIQTHSNFPRPTNINWQALQPKQLQKIPILRQLKREYESCEIEN
ncbi:MAG TPA: 5-formyltetrahydrofolate cyclo-ligase [Leptolyngbyaceae cyanobacterium M33_DOE_097]|uniref:5-formyltetrahydrofolate cyclo-ligase n=1 Tax=Oscillatoriales cyanobacterium SpSt-418 TaxID=2282169 RepID=A0A7C3KJD4_9CYAN|nr:5-formyltetrahydrofolate cyclo-ligase [Leptolyngbyaceae cyanobacterium M33_DOE_097]